jgi:hypothetical protein
VNSLQHALSTFHFRPQSQAVAPVRANFHDSATSSKHTVVAHSSLESLYAPSSWCDVVTRQLYALAAGRSASVLTGGSSEL